MFAGGSGVFTYYCNLLSSPLSEKNGEGIEAKCRTFPEIMKKWGRCRGKNTDLPQKRLITGKVVGRKLIVVSGTRININSQTELYGNNHTQIAVILAANEDLTIKAKIRIFCIVFVVIFQEP